MTSLLNSYRFKYKNKKMKIVKSIMVLSILFLNGCSKDDYLKSDCIETKLIELNMTKYNDQEIGCKCFLELYHFRNKQYFLLGNHCADMISYPIDCDGNKLCENGDNLECEIFYFTAKRIGIIGIEE
jgi:hypothetical protein